MLDRWTNTYHAVKIHVPTTLVALDANTAENEYAALMLLQNRVPEKYAFESFFSHRIRIAGIDRGAGNIRTEKAFQSQRPEVISLLATCDAHKISGAVKHSLKCVDATVSGVVHTGLATAGPSSLVTLRSILEEIFDDELEIVFTQPPDHYVQHVREVLDVFCPVDSNSATANRNARRQFVLKRMCNSDITSKKIIHFCSWNCCPSPQATKQYFLRHVCWALLPVKCKLLQRKSWTSSDLSFHWVGMLSSFWQLHDRVISKFTGKPTPAPSAGEPSACQNTDGQFVSPVELEKQLQMAASGSMDWAEVNRRYAMSASAFGKQTGLREVLTCVSLFLKPAMGLLHAQLDMAGDDWEKNNSSMLRRENQGHIECLRNMSCYKRLSPLCCCKCFKCRLPFPYPVSLAEFGHCCSDCCLNLCALWSSP